VVIKVLHIGLGPVGAAVVRQVASRKGMQSVAAVDIDPAKVGRDLGAVCAVRRKLGISVTDDVTRAIKAAKPDIVVLCTESSLKAVLPQIERVLKLKVPVVSTAEELTYPVKAHRAIAKKIDALARRARVAVLGTGVNPGFAMDALPIALTALSANVDAIEVTRVEPPARRTVHVGLDESVAMIADALGWKLDLIEGGAGSIKGKVLIRLRLEFDAAVAEPLTTIRIAGTPPITATISGIHGDIAAASMIVNSIPKVLTAPPGLRTMKDMVLPSYAGS
jgi:4-hydroxy-tetrahydrodipicolinate reductase